MSTRPAQRHLPRCLTALALSALISTAALAQTSTQLSGNAASAWRATSRLGYGPTAESAQAAQINPKAWALQQIDAAYAASKNPAVIPAELAQLDQPLNAVVRSFQTEREMRRVARAASAMPATTASPVTSPTPAAGKNPLEFERDMMNAAAAWRVAACSNPAMEQPLLAKMTEFWFNHLNVFVGKGSVRAFAGDYVINVIRPNALGNFEDLLLASAHHPAMLYYLDQAYSNARGLNENYARELMELHTLGVNTGYTQNDVRELARILTGWTVAPNIGESFVFNNKQHDQGSKQLLGYNFSADGVQEGEDAIRLLARQPATARRVATRLAMTFVADEPPAALVDRLTDTFNKTGGDIRAVMKTLVASPEFWRADNTLFKTPVDFACSALTAGGGAKDKRDVQLTLGFLEQAGQGMHGWQTPDGYKTSAATWLAPEALTRRADFAMALGSRMPEPAYLEPFLSTNSRDFIASESPNPNVRSGLMLASPDFMRK